MHVKRNSILLTITSSLLNHGAIESQNAMISRFEELFVSVFRFQKYIIAFHGFSSNAFKVVMNPMFVETSQEKAIGFAIQHRGST